MVSDGIMNEIRSLVRRNQCHTAWRLIKSLPVSMSEEVGIKVLREMNEGTI